MSITSHHKAAWVTGAFRAIGRCVVLAGLAAVIPIALAQEDTPPPGDRSELAGDGPGPVAPAPDKEAAAAGDGVSTPREPGAQSNSSATGWGGAVAQIRFVEGAVADAPLKPAAKPRPQNDWFVQRLNAGVPASLNAYTTYQPAVAAITRHTLDRLISVDPDSPPQVVGSLAVSWDVSDKGRTCTYRLRKGVQFADGRPFTSADVVFSFDALRDPAVSAEHLRSSFERVESVEAPDDHTVVVRFKSRHWKAPYIVGPSLPVLHKAWYQDRITESASAAGSEVAPINPGKPGFAAAFASVKEPCPGTGPYYLAEPGHVTTHIVQLTPNPFSWQMQVFPARNNFEALRWVDLPTEGDAFHAFVHGELDVWVVSHAAWEHQLSRDPRVFVSGSHYVYDHIGIDASAIFWNCRQPPFDDANVRKAMTLATDRETILDSVMQGHGVIASCKSKRAYPTYSPEIAPHPFDLDTAEVHLIRAGWLHDTDKDGILDRDGKPFTFELTYPAGRVEFDGIADELELACRQLNIEMRRNPVTSKDFIEAVRNRRFQAIVGFSSWPDPWIDLHGRYHRRQDVRGGGNLTGWHSKEMDKLLEAMQVELDEDVRTKQFHEFNRIFHDEQPETLLVHGKVGVLVAKRLQGISIRPTGLQSFDLWVRPEDVRHRNVQPK